MVGHFLQNNRRNRSSLSQSANTAEDLNGTANITSTSSSNTSSIARTNSGILSTDGNSRRARHNTKIDSNATLNMNSSNTFGYSVNGGNTSNNTNGNNTANTNGNNPLMGKDPSLQYPTVRQAMPNTTYDGSASTHYTPPQNLTAEAVAALPPPGPCFVAKICVECISLYCSVRRYSFIFFLSLKKVYQVQPLLNSALK